MADPDLELRGGGGKAGFSSTALPAFLPSLILFFFNFLSKIKRPGRASQAPPLDPPLIL